MNTFFDYLAQELRSEYESEYVLNLKKNFSTPKTYSAIGDLSKRGYVYFSFRNPKTGKLQRMKNIYGSINNYSIKEDRLPVLSVYRIKRHKLLKEGFNPFENNSDLYKNRLNLKTQKKENRLVNIDSAEIENIKSKDVELPKLSFGSQ